MFRRSCLRVWERTQPRCVAGAKITHLSCQLALIPPDQPFSNFKVKRIHYRDCKKHHLPGFCVYDAGNLHWATWRLGCGAFVGPASESMALKLANKNNNVVAFKLFKSKKTTLTHFLKSQQMAPGLWRRGWGALAGICKHRQVPGRARPHSGQQLWLLSGHEATTPRLKSQGGWGLHVPRPRRKPNPGPEWSELKDSMKQLSSYAHCSECHLLLLATISHHRKWNNPAKPPAFLKQLKCYLKKLVHYLFWREKKSFFSWKKENSEDNWQKTMYGTS